MASTAATPIIPLPNSSNGVALTLKSTLSTFTYSKLKPNFIRHSLSITASLSDSKPKPSTTAAAAAAAFTAITTPSTNKEALIPTLAPQLPRKGCDILVEALEREGATYVFGYPGGASMEIHQAITRSSIIRNILPRHEQGGIFAAEGYAKASGRVGVCIASSGPGATNFVTGLADALVDSVPLVAITGQVPTHLMGTDAFQETPIIEVTRSITKHTFMVLDASDIPRIIKEAFFIASSGRPGPVLVDIPKDIQQQLVIPDWDVHIKLPNYASRLPKSPEIGKMEQIVRLIFESKKPVLYIGGGSLNCSAELRRFVELTKIPVASTLMGLGSFPCSDELSLHMLGMHGTMYANYAVDRSDLLLAFGVRFDDRVTGKVEAFANRARIVHIDIDSSELGKNKQPHVSLCADLKIALKGLNRLLEMKRDDFALDFSSWREEINEQKAKYPLSYKDLGEEIPPQYAIQVLNELTNGNATISTGVGQHQMWSAQFYKFKKPRQLLTSGGLGAMGFGLPAAVGAALGKPNSLVVDVDGDGSFIMNVQELATVRAENLPVKMMILNNQHLGMVVQWEDKFYESNRAHTYLGNPLKEEEIFPDMLKFAEACDIACARVTKRSEVKNGIKKMLETPGPFLLDVIVPHQQHVLPMIPSGLSFKDAITHCDGRINS